MKLATFSLLLLGAAACGSSAPPPSTPAPAPQPPAQTNDVNTVTEAPPPAAPAKPVTTKSLAAVGLDPDALDRTADPCEDFYQFACGGWIAKTEIPGDKPLAMRSFVAIDDRNLEWEKGLLEAAAAKPGDDPVNQKLGTFYASCMDEKARDRDGLASIRPLLQKVDSVHDAKSLGAAVAFLHAHNVGALFGIGSTQDSADATRVIADVEQGGLGLRDRDYYLKDDDQTKKVRTAYHDYIVALLQDAGRPAAAAGKQADLVMKLETDLAQISKDKVARRDPKGMYNKIDRAGVAKLMPHFDWDKFMATLGVPSVTDITVGSPDFMSGLDGLMQSTPPDVWRAYLTVAVLRGNSQFLTKKISDQAFAFQAAMTGQKEQEPLWKRCAQLTDGSLGDLLGQAFVRDKFPGNSKSAAEEQVHAIVSAMQANLGALPWMDAATKQKAIDKLGVMAYQIGFPKKWKTYTFKLDRKTFGANANAARKFENDRDLAKIGKPVDKDDWQMTVPQVNAYYDPQLNGMVFPAGILQPPFYSVDASIPVNLGGMGVVVGHELTHGFDDQGAQYDANGNLRDWWQADTEKAFKARTQCVIDEYSQFEVSGTKLNGANTVGENIADIGGVKLALAAYRSLRAPAPDTVVADGFTEDQQFFLGFGQAWCAKMRPEYEKRAVMLDVHSPAKWRVNGALSSTPDFAKTWGCKAGAKMKPTNQCVVW